MDFVVTHYNNFPKKGRKGQNATIPTASWGEITSKGLDKVVWITKETLKKFAEGEGVVNYIPILRKLFAKGIVYQFEGDRYCTGYTIAGIEVPCYCFKIKGQTPTTKKVKKKKETTPKEVK